MRLAATDYLTKQSPAEPDQDGVIEHHDKQPTKSATRADDNVHDEDDSSTDDDTGGMGTGEYD